MVTFGVASAAYLAQHVISSIADAELSEETAPPQLTRIMAVRLLKEQTEGDAARSLLKLASMPVDASKPVDAASSSAEVTRDEAAAQADDTSARLVATVRGMTYRTVCVRECDGGFFPISFATTSRYFNRDAAACANRCGVPARLFVYPNDGGSPATMVDLQGRPYSALANANRYQDVYRPSCSCRAQPWSQEAQSRQRIEALKDKGDRLEDGERKELQLLAAVDELRTLRGDGLAALRTGNEGETAHVGKRSMPLAGDRAPLIGGKDNEAPVIVMNFEPPFKPATVVHDATGRAVILKVAPKNGVPPAVTVIAKAPDVVIEPPHSVALLSDEVRPYKLGQRLQTGGVATSLLGPAAVRPAAAGSLPSLKGTTAAHQAQKPGHGSRKTSGFGVARGKTLGAKVADGRRAGSGRTASADDWYGKRLYTGNDWRLTTFQMLE